MRALGQARGGEPRVTSALLRGVTDPDAWVRYYAIQSLGRLGVEAGASAIATRVDDPAGQVRVAAIEALSHLRGEVAFGALRQAAGSADADLRRAALVGLGLSRRADAEAAVLEAAADPDAATRLVAVCAVADFDGAVALAALEKAAGDRDESVRTAAIGFLAARPGREATQALVRLLAHESERDRIVGALSVFTPEHISGIVAALGDADDETAALLVSALVRMHRPEANLALVDAFALPNARARKAIASGLSAIGSAEASLTLQRAAKADLDPEVRRIATLLVTQ
jgi:HEAT repeat protein